MKKRKFADGGIYEDPTPQPTPGVGAPGVSTGGTGSSSAFGGLNTINQGAGQVGKALQSVSGSLGQAYNAIGSPGGFKSGLGPNPTPSPGMTMKKGGKVKGYAKGGSVASASKRGDGIAQRGKTKGRMV
jgi:hypothetical protein